jgi:Flp pilus assembly protein TadD
MPSSLPRALAAFEDAATKDPGYAAPHAGMADLHLVSGFSGLVPPRDAWRLAGEAADRALARDPGLPAAHVAKAYRRLFDGWDFSGAEQELLRARDAEPLSAATHQWTGLFHAMLGRLDAAEAALREARTLDPASVIVESLEAFLALLRGDRRRELAAARRAAELEPHRFLGHWSLGLALLRAGRRAEAVASHRRAVELANGAPLLRAVLARTLALAGHRFEARRLVSELCELPHASRYQLATVQLALGSPARALESLADAVEAREPWVVWLAVDPMLAGIRRRRGFQALLGRVFGASIPVPSRASRRSAAAPPRAPKGPPEPGAAPRSRRASGRA